MNTSTIIQSEKLKCDCGSEQFVPVVTLNHSPGGGTTSSPAGYQCQACTAVVNIGSLVKNLQHKNLRRQMKEMQEELGEAATDRAPLVTAPTAPTAGAKP